MFFRSITTSNRIKMGLQKLWTRIVCGEHSFEALLEPHVGYLFRLAYHFSGNRDDAEDLVQDLLAKLYPRAAELRELEQLRPWLARVLYRMYIDRCRSVARSPVVRPLADATDADQCTHPAPGPEAAAENDDLQQRLTHALGRLNADQRAVVILHDIEGYTLVELQDVLGVPLGTLKSRLNRAHAQLRQQLETGPKSVEPFPARQRLIG